MAGCISVGDGQTRARDFAAALRGAGYEVFTGVPCSLLGPLYDAVSGAGGLYLAATREDLAVGLAVGASLAGRRAAVLLQNSGLGLSVNALQSLVSLYQVPLLLVVSWRGEGPDAPEHVASGRTTAALLDLLEVPHRMALAPDAFDPAFHAHAGPVALVVRKGDFAGH